MSDLERQCEHADEIISMIVRDLWMLQNPWHNVDVDDRNAMTSKWRKSIKPLCRPVEAKEIAEIQDWLSKPIEHSREAHWAAIQNCRLVLRALAESQRQNARLLKACQSTEQEVQQVLGKALGYPWYKDDQKNFQGATEADGVCVGEHVSASIADEAAQRIIALENKCALHAASEKKAEEELDQYRTWCQRWQQSLYGAATAVDADTSGNASQIADSIRGKFEQLQSKLAAYDACLTQVREERPIVNGALDHIGAQDCENQGGEYAELLASALLVRAYVFELQHAEAANRNAIAVAQGTIAALKSDLSAQIAQRLESGSKFAECLERANAAEARERGLKTELEKLQDARRPTRTMLRDLVDRAWNEATESEQVPSTEWADRIIDTWIAAQPAVATQLPGTPSNVQIPAATVARIVQPAAVGREDKASGPDMHLTGHQVNSLREFTDGDPDFEIVIQELQERTAVNGQQMQAGLYVWSADYPEEGVMLLEEHPHGTV